MFNCRKERGKWKLVLCACWGVYKALRESGLQTVPASCFLPSACVFLVCFCNSQTHAVKNAQHESGCFLHLALHSSTSDVSSLGLLILHALFSCVLVSSASRVHVHAQMLMLMLMLMLSSLVLASGHNFCFSQSSPSSVCFLSFTCGV